EGFLSPQFSEGHKEVRSAISGSFASAWSAVPVGSGQRDRTHQIRTEFCRPFRQHRIANREGSPQAESFIVSVLYFVRRFRRTACSAVPSCQCLGPFDLAEALSEGVNNIGSG